LPDPSGNPEIDFTGKGAMGERDLIDIVDSGRILACVLDNRRGSDSNPKAAQRWRFIPELTSRPAPSML
jgi:hypothetical protein